MALPGDASARAGSSGRLPDRRRGRGSQAGLGLLPGRLGGTGRLPFASQRHRSGEYARETFDPQWWCIVDEYLRIRSGEGGRALYRRPLTRRGEALDFVVMAIEDPHRVG